MPRSRRPALAVLTLVGLTLAAAAPAQADDRPGVQHLQFRFGPIDIKPGQNTIELEVNDKRPKVDGYITSFRPNLVRAKSKVPPVDVIHLHHAVWLVNFQPTFAAGEEKTEIRVPKGFGWRYRSKDRWMLNHMIHNLTPNRERVWVTWDMDFIPADSSAAKGMREVKTQWLDVQGGNAYPVFDVLRGRGAKGRFTYPDDDPNAYPDGVARNRWVADRDATLVGTAGHLHPGGLYSDLRLTRGGRTVRLFRSRAKYYEPAGPVSWDVSMTATPSRWRVAVRKGDILSVSGTYDTRRGSWYESMAIMPVAITNGRAGGADPFTTKVDVPGVLTHGHLPENDNHGGSRAGYQNPSRLPDGPSTDRVTVNGFLYGQGDLSMPGVAGRPPVVTAGQPLTFVNADAKRNIFHTITSCKLPCNGTSGIAFPLANGPVEFDSGNLGFGPQGFTAAANRDRWQTPPALDRGTYAFFCRVHPFMRGSFRVK